MSATLYRMGVPGLLRAASGAPVFIATSSAVDRMGDVVAAEGVDWSAWRKNPVILAQHNHARPVARGGALERYTEGGVDGWSIEIRFPPPGIRDSDEARQLVDAGVLSAVSIGFIARDSRPPTRGERERGVTGKVHVRSEIIEVSLVSVPAQSEAVRIRSLAPRERLLAAIEAWLA